MTPNPAVSIVMVVGGFAWLGWLRHNAPTWHDAMERHQVQGFNGLVLVGIGGLMAVIAIAELVVGAGPQSDLVRWIVAPVWITVMIWVADRLLPVDWRRLGRRPPGPL